VQIDQHVARVARRVDGRGQAGDRTQVDRQLHRGPNRLGYLGAELKALTATGERQDGANAAFSFESVYDSTSQH